MLLPVIAAIYVCASLFVSRFASPGKIGKSAEVAVTVSSVPNFIKAVLLPAFLIATCDNPEPAPIADADEVVVTDTVTFPPGCGVKGNINLLFNFLFS